jgi:hypothetical protein
LAGIDQLILQGARTVENVLNQRRRYAGRASKASRQIGDQAIGGLCCCGKRVLGALALLLGDLLLRNRKLPLLKRQSGKHKRDDEAGAKAASQNIPPARRTTATFGDKSLHLRGRLGRAARPRGDPALGLL